MRGRGKGVERIGRIGALACAGLSLALALSGCSGGLFPEPVTVTVDPQACGSSRPRYAPYFTASPTRGAAPLDVAFSSNGADVIEWRWSFGDGATSALPAPTHKYMAAGTYTVRLTVTRSLADGSGRTSTSTYERKRYIHVTGKPDLRIAALTHAPELASPGTVIAFTVTVHNDGNAAALPNYVRVAGAGSRLVRIPRLDPGASATVTTSATMSRDPETFIVEVDATAQVRESDESNNAVTHVVSSAP